MKEQETTNTSKTQSTTTIQRVGFYCIISAIIGFFVSVVLATILHSGYLVATVVFCFLLFLASGVKSCYDTIKEDQKTSKNKFKIALKKLVFSSIIITLIGFCLSFTVAAILDSGPFNDFMLNASTTFLTATVALSFLLIFISADQPSSFNNNMNGPTSRSLLDPANPASSNNWFHRKNR